MADSATHLLLIRHAPIDTGARLCGTCDVPLTVAGRAQLHAMLRRAATRPAPDALYTSTLRRASEVATALSRAWALEARGAEWAREIHCGRLEGMPLDQVRSHHPDLWARNQAQTDDDFAWPEGESYRAFRARVLAGMSAVAAAHAGGRVALVTHAGVISQLLGVLRQRPPAVWAEDRPDPFTATELIWQHGQPVEVVAFNEPNWF